VIRPRPARSSARSRIQQRAASADVLLLAAVTISALNFSVVKIGLKEIQPLAFPVVRYGVGGLVLLFILHMREGSVSVRRADLPVLLLTSVLAITLSQIMFVFALANTGASDTALLMATAPVVTTVLATIAGLERAEGRHWVAAAFGLSGASLVIAGGAAPGHLGGSLFGDGLALGNVLVSSAAILPIPSLMRRYSALRILTWEMLIGTAVLLPVALPSLLMQDYGHITITGWTALAYAVVLSGIVANLLYFTAIGRVGPSHAAIYQYVQSLLAVGFAVALLGEQVTVTQLVGGAIVVGSVALSRAGRPAQYPAGPDSLEPTQPAPDGHPGLAEPPGP
jgi:drug/metabolite transporter (DMT)-like permease